MTPTIVNGKTVAFEISHKMGKKEVSSSSKGKSLVCSEKKNMKGKRVETSSSSSSSSEDEEEDENDDDSSDDDQSSSSTSNLDKEAYFKCHYLANGYGRGHSAQVLHVVKDGDDACIFLLW